MDGAYAIMVYSMKQRSTTPVSHKQATKVALVVMAAVVAGAGIFQTAGTVFARDYEAEIRAKQQEANSYNSQAARLGEMAATLEEELNRLTAQVNALQSQIIESQNKIDSLKEEIKNNEAAINRNRKTMGQILSDMYVDDQISPLEMLASSENIGDFIDKQEQRSSLQGSLNDKIKEIKRLQKKLQDNKAAVERTLKDQETQKAQMAAKQAEQAKLVNDTKNDQAAYSSLASQRNSEIAKLREQQAAENLRSLPRGSVPSGTPGGGGYPGAWANAPLDAYVDPWGLYTRQCVSYVAWKVHSTGRYVPHFGGAGNANQWPSTTARHGISNGSTPRAGAAAVIMGGAYGHVMYVESVNGDGTITVSDYNLGWDGLYRNYKRSSSGLVYIYF